MFEAYQFIGWDRISELTSNQIFSSWLVDHMVFLGFLWSLWYAFTKITPWKWDDKLAEDVKQAVGDAVPKV